MKAVVRGVAHARPDLSASSRRPHWRRGRGRDRGCSRARAQLTGAGAVPLLVNCELLAEFGPGLSFGRIACRERASAGRRRLRLGRRYGRPGRRPRWPPPTWMLRLHRRSQTLPNPTFGASARPAGEARRPPGRAFGARPAQGTGSPSTVIATRRDKYVGAPTTRGAHVVSRSGASARWSIRRTCLRPSSYW
jgi:hypothetical protein